ncbi:MAG: zinc ABC transporter substrate-binding protein [Coleofasciculus sp. C3-bin4]|nr:zinc ABC transporter substrate-binding protein [Coleofasciculus sp. C3-bin4]
MLKSFSLKTRSLGSIAVLAVALGFAGCTSSQQPTNSSPNTTSAASPSSSFNSKPKVVATTSVLCDITEKIAQDTVDLTCLIPAGTDAHVYQPKPSDRKAIEEAKLILYNGYDFEPSLIKLIQATKNQAPKVAVNEVAVPNPQQFEEEGKTETDPHVWQNAQNGVRIVETIRDNLEKVSPSNAAQYTDSAKKMTSELTQIDNWIKSQISTIPANQRKLVTTHDALGYYSKAYGIPVEGALQGISTEERPTAGREKELVEVIKNANVPTIFAETTVNPKLIEAVAKEGKVKVSKRELFADGLGEKGSEGDTYEKMLIANTKTIVEGLGGKYTAFEPK